MPLHLLLGESQRETSAVLRDRLIRSSLSHPDQRHILLVPEQFTLQTQRDVVFAHPDHAVLNIDILSFERLAYRILGKTGRDVRILTEAGMNMLLRRAAGRHREELSLYRNSLDKPGFISRMMSMLSEFYEYGVTEEDLFEAAERIPSQPLLARKLKELGILFAAMREEHGEEEVAAEELLSVCLRMLPQSDFADGAFVALDYFTGFTPVQREILRHLLSRSADLSAAFCLPEEEDKGDEIRESELFYMSRIATVQLEEMARSAGDKAEKEYIRRRDSGRPEELDFLAEHFLRSSRKAAVFKGIPSAIHVGTARNPREECRMAAARIARLVREDGLRYREIAVAAGDLELYRIPLTMELSRAGIPWFCDRKRGVLGNPLVEYLRSALEIPEKDFSADSVFRYLRSGLVPIEENEIDVLDLYVAGCGIRGKKRWQEPWTRQPDPRRPADLSRLNEIREAVLQSLQPVLEASSGLTSERTEALRRMMDRADAGEQMKERAARCLEEGDLERAGEFSRITEFVRGLLEETDRLFGTRKIRREEFSDILDAGLESARLGVLPGGLDQVQIGDLRRSRLTNVQVLLVLGVNDGVIPQAPASGGILTETERSLLSAYHLELAPAAEPAAIQERFYLYMLLTRPEKAVYLSAACTNADGTAARPSGLLTQLLHLFPEIRVDSFAEWDWKEKISGRTSAWQIAAETMRDLSEKRDPATADAAFSGFLRALYEEDESGRLPGLLRTAFRTYEGERLEKETATALYGPDLSGSVTRMEEFASCAARQFLNYGLRLKEKIVPEITPAGRGSILHRILQRFFELLRESGLDRKRLSDNDREELSRKAVESVFSEEPSFGFVADREGEKLLIRRWKNLADRTIWILCEQMSESDFSPEAFELHFSGWHSRALRTDLPGGGKMVLNGTTDRLDVLDEEQRRWVRIVDYKTGSRQFDLNEIWAGISFQLVLYLDAVLETQKKLYPDKEILPGGIYYQPVKENRLPSEKAESALQIRDARLKASRLNGLANTAPAVTEHQEEVKAAGATTEQFFALIRHVRRILDDCGEKILEGEISASPVRKKKQRSCDYCPYASVCGFDPKTAGYRDRILAELPQKEIWERLMKEETT